MQKYKNKWRVKNEEWRILWNMLENTISGTNCQLQGTIYRLIRSIIRWEVDALTSRSKVKGRRSKVKGRGFVERLRRWDEVASLRWQLAMAIAMESGSHELQYGNVAMEYGSVCWTPLPLAILFRAVVEGVSKIKLGADYADYTDLYFKFIPDHTLDK